jgi:rSAM/selenodomain-associated transferase 1
MDEVLYKNSVDSRALNIQRIEWIVLTKAPVPGLVKTRLIPELGEQAACDLYLQLLKRLELSLKRVLASGLPEAESSHVALWIAGDAGHEAFKSWASISTFYQQPTMEGLAEADLGYRMAVAVKSALSRGCIPVLIGVDVPDLDEAYLQNCMKQLETNDLVISPAEDGGYGLLGMKQFYSELFTNKQWGGDSVFSSTKSDIDKLSIDAGYLPIVWDVDEPADVKRFRLLG